MIRGFFNVYLISIFIMSFGTHFLTYKTITRNLQLWSFVAYSTTARSLCFQRHTFWACQQTTSRLLIVDILRT
jgi:hypothetical protein